MGMGLAGLIPFLLVGKGARLGAAFVLYLMAFLMAGFVTPGLDQWTMQLAQTIDGVGSLPQRISCLL